MNPRSCLLQEHYMDDGREAYLQVFYGAQTPGMVAMAADGTPCPVCRKVIPSSGDEKHGLIAMFHSGRYLNDVQCQRLTLEISENWQKSSRGSLGKYPIDRFSPLTFDDIKRTDEVDAYAISIDCAGNLIRTHLVKKAGVAFTNPPPTDHRCESCHRDAGPLRKHFQYSTMDKANIAAWLCVDCEALPSDKREVGF